MSRLHRGRRQLRELLANYTPERGMAGAASAAGPQRHSSDAAAKGGRK